MEALHRNLRWSQLLCLIRRVLAIPQKRGDRTIVTFLDSTEIDALLAAPDRTRWVGRRDHVLLAAAVQTGLRVSELIALTCQDVRLGTGTHVRCQGKERKERVTPLTAQTAAILKTWLAERPGAPTDPLFPGPTGRRLSRDAVALIKASRICGHILPIAQDQDRVPPRPPSHLCHAAPVRRCGHVGDRPLAWA